MLTAIKNLIAPARQAVREDAYPDWFGPSINLLTLLAVFVTGAISGAINANLGHEGLLSVLTAGALWVGLFALWLIGLAVALIVSCYRSDRRQRARG